MILLILEDIILYDTKGEPAAIYKKVTFDEAVTYLQGEYTHTQDGWIAYFNSLHDGRVMPSLPLYYAVIERLQETEHPAASGLLRFLQKEWLCTSTKINYKQKIIIHGFGVESYEFKCTIPFDSGLMDEVKGSKRWRSVLQALFMPKELDAAIETLQNFGGTSSCVITPSEFWRKQMPERGIRIGAPVCLLIDAALHSGVGCSYSYGVRLER